MLSSLVAQFSELDEYTAIVRGSTFIPTVTGRGIFASKLTRIDLHSLWMQHFAERLSQVSDISLTGDRDIIGFRTEDGPTLTLNGSELSAASVVRLHPDLHFYLRSAGIVSYGSISLPPEEMTAACVAILGHEVKPPDSVLMITPRADALAKLQRLYSAAVSLAADAPAVLSHPEAARAIEQALTEAMVGCVDEGGSDEDSAARRQHAAIMQRFQRVIEKYVDRPMYIPELCREVGASQRTLLACCQERLGMGPKHYLLLRRMHMVRRALRESAPTEATVTEIATRYGFWHFGRLAVEYKTLFGEAPSVTLARPA